MTRNTMLLVVVAVLGLSLGSGLFKYLGSRETAALRATGDSLRLEVAATNVRLDAFSGDSARFQAFRDSTDALGSRLRAELQQVQGRTRGLTLSLDSARLTVHIDTLAPVLRGMILLEREMAQSFLQERDLERELRQSTETQLAAFRERLQAAEALIFSLRGERDSAMVLVARHESRLTFNLWRFLGDEIPQLLACSAGGAVVATLNDGNELIGAGIGLAACLVKGAIF